MRKTFEKIAIIAHAGISFIFVLLTVLILFNILLVHSMKALRPWPVGHLEFTLICINLHEEINACSIITVKLLRAQLSWHT